LSRFDFDVFRFGTGIYDLLTFSIPKEIILYWYKFQSPFLYFIRPKLSRNFPSSYWLFDECPSKNEGFGSSSRKAKILTTGIYENISRIKI
jgi:hypothetical protein